MMDRGLMSQPPVDRCSARISLAGSATQRILPASSARIAIFPVPGAPVRM